jgi:hypothetical protein
MYRYRKKILFLTIVLLLMPASGMARIGQWVPSIVDYEADIDIYGTYKMYDATTNDLDYGQKTLIMQENLNLGLYGYLYHPRLIEYKLRLTLGFRQDRFETETNVSSYSRSRSGTSNGFNFRTKILPMHPYNRFLQPWRCLQI